MRRGSLTPPGTSGLNDSRVDGGYGKNLAAIEFRVNAGKGDFAVFVLLSEQTALCDGYYVCCLPKSGRIMRARFLPRFYDTVQEPY